MQVAAPLAGVRGEQDLAGLADRFDDRLVVEGDQAAGIDDLATEAMGLLQLLGGFEGALEGGADGQEGEVLACLANRGFP